MAVELTQKSLEVFNYIKENGGKVAITELANALREGKVRSVNANVTDLAKKELVVREKEAVEGEEKPVTYVVLTETGHEVDGVLKAPKPKAEKAD